MKAIAIDSSTTRLSVAVKNDDYTVSSIFNIGMRQSETLIPAIDACMEKAGLAASELDFTVLTSGPGSFTGLRLGFSALKALTLAYDTPLYGIPTLSAYAEPYKTLSFAVLCAIDAKKDRFYAALSKNDTPIIPDGDYTPEELSALLAKHVPASEQIIVCGPDSSLIFSELQKVGYPNPLLIQSTPIVITDVLFEMAQKSISEKIPPLAEYVGPEYIRASEAEVKLK